VEPLGSGILGAAGGILFSSLIFYAVVRRRESVLGQKAEEEAKRTAAAEAGRLAREAEIAAKEKLLAQREEFEQEVQATRAELREAERRLAKREEGVDRKFELSQDKERVLLTQESELRARIAENAQRERDLGEIVARQTLELERLSGLTREEAVALFLSRLEEQCVREAELIVHRSRERAREVADREARDLVLNAIERTSVSHYSDVCVSTVALPSDEMKGRIIGREGRNIRAFEQVTGVDVIVDDTPGVIVLSAFEPVRREVARRAMEKLIVDGRIHPARIEELVEKTRCEMDGLLVELGRESCLETDVQGLHPKLVVLLGRLEFRTSYGQKVRAHAIEVAHLCGVMASELGLDAALARRCGLLHDIGKAVDHEVEGGHPEIGARLARRYGERQEVINAVESHHDNVPQESPYAVLAQIADGISGGRPGARGESLEHYLKRMERLEGVASGHPGVRQAYAIQAGRELRIIVHPTKVSDRAAAKLAREIAKEIEERLSYPGEVKVTVIREVRVVESAH
jgi:ribonuclease Y